MILRCHQQRHGMVRGSERNLNYKMEGKNWMYHILKELKILLNNTGIDPVCSNMQIEELLLYSTVSEKNIH